MQNHTKNFYYLCSIKFFIISNFILLMKKFTFLFVAAIMAVGANAQWGTFERGLGKVGNYNLLTDAWINEVPALNKQFTLAIEITDGELQTWLNASPHNTISVCDFRFLTPTGAVIEACKKSFRLERQPDGFVFAVNIVVKQVWSEFDLTTGAEIADDGFIYCHFQIGTAWAGGEGTTVDGTGWKGGIWESGTLGYGNIAVAPATGADADPINCGYEVGGDPEYVVPGICLPSHVENSIETIFANPQEVERIEYFNLQGMKLQAEPQEGLFIAVPIYKGGVRGEAVKVLNRR